MEYSMTGLANSATTSLRMWMLSASKARRCVRAIFSIVFNRIPRIDLYVYRITGIFQEGVEIGGCNTNEESDFKDGTTGIARSPGDGCSFIAWLGSTPLKRVLPVVHWRLLSSRTILWSRAATEQRHSPAVRTVSILGTDELSATRAFWRWVTFCAAGVPSPRFHLQLMGASARGIFSRRLAPFLFIISD